VVSLVQVLDIESLEILHGEGVKYAQTIGLFPAGLFSNPQKSLLLPLQDDALAEFRKGSGVLANDIARLSAGRCVKQRTD